MFSPKPQNTTEESLAIQQSAALACKRKTEILFSTFCAREEWVEVMSSLLLLTTSPWLSQNLIHRCWPSLHEHFTSHGSLLLWLVLSSGGKSADTRLSGVTLHAQAISDPRSSKWRLRNMEHSIKPINYSSPTKITLQSDTAIWRL